MTPDGSKVRDKKPIAQPFTPNEPFPLLSTISCFLADAAYVVKPSCGQMHQHAHDWKMMFLLLSLWLLWLLPCLLLSLLGHLVICLCQNNCDPHSAGRVCHCSVICLCQNNYDPHSECATMLQNTSQNSRVKGREQKTKNLTLTMLLQCCCNEEQMLQCYCNNCLAVQHVAIAMCCNTLQLQCVFS